MTREQRENRAAVIAARMREYDLDEVQASNPVSSTALGRMMLRGELSKAQYEAGEEFREIVRLYRKAIMARSEGRGARGGIDDVETDAYADWCQNKIDRFDTWIDAIKDLCRFRGSKDPWEAVMTNILQDREVTRLTGDLREALNVFNKRFNSARGRNAA